MTEKITFKFHGREEVLDIIDTGGHLSEYLSNSSNNCPLIGSEIKFIKKLGKGQYGVAFLIKIKGMGEKEYVAKVDQRDGYYKTLELEEAGYTLSYVAEKLEERNNIPSDLFIFLNGNNPEKEYGKGFYTFIYPNYTKLCKTKKTKKIDRLDGNGEIIIPKGSYICKTEQYSEYVIGVLCGNLYRKGLSINFLDVFGFTSCLTEDNLSSRQYVFMEKSGGTLYNFFQKIENKSEDVTIESIFIQMLHAIASYQHYYKLQHNDLHMSNILIEKITKDTTYMDQNLLEADWFHYKIFDTDIYLPKTKFIIKIIDFGASVKYSEPVVGNKKSLLRGQASNETEKPWVPNWYSESSDCLFSIDDFYVNTSSNIFIENIYCWVLGLNKNISNKKKWIEIQYKNTFIAGGKRPDLKLLTKKYSRSTPKNILQNSELMENYLKAPNNGKIITLGNIS